MKIIILISGVAGALLLMLGMLGVFIEFNGEGTVLVSGLVLLTLVCLPLYLVDKHREDRKIDQIIKSYEGRKKKEPEPAKGGQSPRGWGMNDSPFRERKSGLTWGGGNIKAAEATRGKRRKFLKR